MDLFREVKERVPVIEAARRYGFEPDRQGKICCPFHDDSRPSLQLYKGARGWWCYVCDRGGSVIDFVAGLFSISPREAALKLNEDFSLGLAVQRPRTLESRSSQHRRVVESMEKRRFREAYQERQEEFIFLHQEKTFLFPKGGRAGQLMGRMGQLEEWFRENPWR